MWVRNVVITVIALWLFAFGADAAISSSNQTPQYGSFYAGASNSNQIYSKPAAEAKVKSQLTDRYDHRYPDGSYEFRYELSDGTARYERGYFVLIDKVKTLVVVGYYSYRMPDGRYITVFYNADQFGYRQNQSITPQTYPNLPRSIEVPEVKDTGYASKSSATTPNPRISTTTTRRGRF